MARVFIFLALCFLPMVSVQAEEALPQLQTEEVESPEDTKFIQEFLYMLFVLGVMVAALLGGTWAIKKMMQSKIEKQAEASSIRLMDQRPLTPRTTIYVLNVRGREITISESNNGVTYLGSRENPVPVEFEKVFVKKSNA